MVILVVIVLILGVNFTLWGMLGLLRILEERILPRARHSLQDDVVHQTVPTVADVALLIPAHNEELVLGRTIESACALMPRSNIYIVSDGSQDGTDALAEQLGTNVLRLMPARGKASALTAGLRHFDLAARYKVVLLLDADTGLSPDYLTEGLQHFADPDVVAVAGSMTTDWRPRERSLVTRFLLAHRDRVYLLTQLLQKFGQSWRRANVVHIVPGAASMYRTEVIQHIDLDAPGLVIEDFNMTFEVHHKGLGKIAFHPHVRAYTQDPDNFGDYVRQMRRWSLGFWQTIRRHGFWPSRFSLALVVTVFDLVISSLFFVSLPLVVLALGMNELFGGAVPVLDPLITPLAAAFHPKLIVLAVILPDYALTVAAAIIQRRPQYLVLGLGFLAMRIVDAATSLYTLPMAWRARSSGRWTSPTRRALIHTPPEPVP